jgi:DNA invertase Pin-like site-specific DNA recombinase
MTKVGYARVSTTDQDLDLQLAALKAAGCDVVRAEKRSGTSTKGRDELRTILDFIHKGDTLVDTASIGWRARSATCRTLCAN